MPLTREQLAVLPPPAGWVWYTRPSLRTRGLVVLDEAHGVGRNNAGERIARLAQWAEANDLGVKVVPPRDARTVLGRNAYTIVVSNYYDVPFPKLFKVTANSHDDSTFGEYTCSCGYKLIRPHEGDAACENCGTHKCAYCGAGFVKLYKVATDDGDYMYCGTCTKPCTTCSTSRVRGSGGCTTCDPRILCIVCMIRKKSDEVTAIPSAQVGTYLRRIGAGQTEAHICNTCKPRFFCEKCKMFDFATKRATGTACATCKAKELDKKRVPLEKLPDDWIPAGGSLHIPATDFRPFRTISLEMELDGDGDLAARTLYACGLVPIPTVASYQQHPDVQLEYPCFMKHDGSVTAGELIAYLLNLDDKAHADVLLDVCKKVHSLEGLGKVSHGPTAGGHIHVDAHNFSIGDVWRLLTVFNYLEDPLFRIAGAGAEFGHRSLRPEQRSMRSGGYAASPVKGPFGTKGVLGQSIAGQNRHHGLNFSPYLSSAQVCKCGSMMYDDAKNCKCNLGKSTIEFRLFNSTHNPRILHAWIALVQALMSWSTGDGDPTAEWETRYPTFTWTCTPYKNLNETLKGTIHERLEWIFLNLPLTENERDSLVYAIEQSDIQLEAGQADQLRGIRPLTDFEVKKAARNPARRQRAIRVGTPTPGEPPVVPARRGQRIFSSANQRQSYQYQQFTAQFVDTLNNTNARISPVQPSYIEEDE